MTQEQLRCNILRLNIVQRLGLEDEIRRSNVSINCVHGNITQAYGCLTTECVYKGQKYDMSFQILNGKNNLDLLCRMDIDRLGLAIRVNAADRGKHVLQVNG